MITFGGVDVLCELDVNNQAVFLSGSLLHFTFSAVKITIFVP